MDIRARQADAPPRDVPPQPGEEIPAVGALAGGTRLRAAAAIPQAAHHAVRVFRAQVGRRIRGPLDEVRDQPRLDGVGPDASLGAGRLRGGIVGRFPILFLTAANRQHAERCQREGQRDQGPQAHEPRMETS